jgi:hypothetical protein
MKWFDFEQALHFMIAMLFQECEQLYFPLDLEDYPFPLKFSYLHSHIYESTARKCAINACDAFLPLMAMCSFAMSLHLQTEDLLIATDPPWISILVNKGKVHPEWVNHLKSSFIGDFSGSVARVGVLVKVQTLQWSHHLQRLRDAKVPVWLFWGSLKNLPTCSPIPRLSVFFPTQQQIDAAGQANVHQAQVSQANDSAASSSAAPDPLTSDKSTRTRFPQPSPNSRQRYGETWQDFFAREAIRHKRIAQMENFITKTA